MELTRGHRLDYGEILVRENSPRLRKRTRWFFQWRLEHNGIDEVTPVGQWEKS